MTAKKVKGNSPVTFISEDTITSSVGTQRQIPLSLITYDATSTTPVAIANASVAGKDLDLASKIISGLIKQGVLNTID